MSRIIMLAAILLSGVFLPQIVITALVFLLLTQLLLSAFPLFALFAGRKGTGVNVNRPALSRTPTFSIHIATHDEPADMVITTLKGLLAQDYPTHRFEILVLDNNTVDPRLWEPVKHFCDLSGSAANIKFYHDMAVQGAKAGALQLGLARMSSDAEYVVTVDADYCVNPDFLQRAAHNLQKTGADYIQFPQAYHNLAPADRHLQREYRSYFSVFCVNANTCGAALPTGTLTVISKTALMDCGMWSGQSITEDAELGVRLQCHGFQGYFCDEVVGKGLLPLALDGFLKQRYRWSLGNMEAMKANYRLILAAFDPACSRAEKVRMTCVIAQLSAWYCFGLVGAVMLILAILAYQLSAAPVYLTIVHLSSLVVILAGIRQGFPILLCAVREKHSLAATVTTLLLRAGATPVQSFGTIAGMLSIKTSFFRTPKCSTLHDPVTTFLFYDHLIVAGALFGLGFGFITENFLALTASFLMVLPFFGKLILARCINSYSHFVVNGVSRGNAFTHFSRGVKEN